MSVGVHITGDVIKAVGGKSYDGAADKLMLEHSSRCGQMFIMVPQQAKWVTLDDAEIRGLRTRGFRMWAHANYQSHMCNTASHGIIHMQIKRAIELDLSGLIVHLENVSIEENIEAAVSLLAYRAGHLALSQHPAPIVFEVNSVTKSPTFDTGAKLRAFVVGVAARGYQATDFGVCIDTAHLWVCGANIRLSSAMSAWLREFHETRFIKLFHLNDSERELGRGPDSHAPIGRGHIWPIHNGSGKASYHFAGITRQPGVPADREPSFLEVLRFAKQHAIDVILERGKESVEEALEELAGVIGVRAHLRV